MIRPLLPLILPHAGIVLVALWVGGAWSPALAGAAVVFAGALHLFLRALAGARRGEHVAPEAASAVASPPWALGLLAIAIAMGFASEGHLQRVGTSWEDRARVRTEEVRERLSRDLDDLLLAGEAAAARLVALHDSTSGRPSVPIPVELVSRGVDAVAVFGPGGELLAWEGHHQGPIPREAKLGLSPYIYAESALFGYLYLTRPLPEGTGTAVAASLLRADLPAMLGDASGDFISRFHAASGARIEVGQEERVEGTPAWGLTWERETLFSVAVVPPSEAETRATIGIRWRWGVTLLLVGLWAGLARATRRVPWGTEIAALTLVGLLFILPAGALTGESRLFSPADLLLPGPFTITLGDLIVLSAGIVIVQGLLFGDGRSGPSLPPRFGIPLHLLRGATVAITIGSAWLVLRILAGNASRDLLAGPEPFWVLFHLAAFLTVGWITTGILHLGRCPGRSRPIVWITGAVLAALIVAIGSVAAIRATSSFPGVVVLFWALPVFLLTRAMESPGASAVGVRVDGEGEPDPVTRQRWRDGALHWIGVGIVVASLTLPWAWGARVEARIAAAEDRIERLGIRPDPFLEFLLLRTGEEARRLTLTGREPVETLYGAWTGSGLAREGVPVWLTWWSPDGYPQEELRIGVATPRPQVPAGLRVGALVDDAVQLLRFDLAEVHYIIAAPLAEGAVLTAVVPPRRDASGDSPLGPLFSPARADPDPLSLIPVLPDETVAAEDGVRWSPSRDGWLAEVVLAFPDQTYLGQYAVTLPGPLLVPARGTLLLLASLATLLLLWTGGRRLVTRRAFPVRRVVSVLSSFRGRVTLALFAFFLIPTSLFGMLAYRTISAASVRTAETLAARAAEDAAAGFTDTGGALEVLAARVGSDLLLYEGGQLVGGSQRELVELGLYPGWLPPAVHRTMAGSAEILTTTTASLGGWSYVVAYRRIAGGRVLAAPAALQAGATAVGQREVADFLAFALVLGAGLSVLLALLVGRALSRPIQTLQIASERVGSGNMGVHLPADRTDEFGAVFGAFNRMVDRLARTRRALVRSSRRTRAIVEEVATGVVAVDAHGRVTLANPRAEALLGIPLLRNLPIPETSEDGAPRTDVAAWVSEYLRDGMEEAGTELTLQGRRIRIRARRISGVGGPGGAVLALEDVTDELRTERILAWGEMAQQVAHEVKNPLTPIKLGIQHIRRAWDDRRPDYDEILERNVSAILDEIERLSAISTSFSRYAAPSFGATGPLDPVDVERVVAEVMTLYSAGEGTVAFEADVEPGLPDVASRTDELKEVLVNLLENARVALPDGGRVTVRACRSADDVLIVVDDDGTGIAEELLPRIFEPHFSTRTAGTGLGLAIVRRLVESWGGRVRVDSTPDVGTRVEIRLAAAPGDGVSDYVDQGPEGEGGASKASSS